MMAQLLSLMSGIFFFTDMVTGSSLPSPLRTPRLGSSAADITFQRAVDLCERCLNGDPAISEQQLHENVPDLLAEVFDADFEAVTRCERSVSNVTCLCPKDGVDGQSLINDELVTLQAFHVDEGRRQCWDGGCSSACSRAMFTGFASQAECEALRRGVEALVSPAMQSEECTLDLSELCATGDVATTLLFLRLLERLRRTVAHEYGLPLSCVFTQSAFTSRIPHIAGQADYGATHADESSSDQFHYSAVLHLQTSGEGFTGGDFVFSDKPREEEEGADPLADRVLTRVPPLQGRAIMFSSGWENLHYVDGVSSGVRFALPVFFRTTGEESLKDHTRDLCGWLSHTWGNPQAFAELQRAVLGVADGDPEAE